MTDAAIVFVPAGRDKLGEALQGCRLVLLVATHVEAEPLRVALGDAQQHTVATKTLYVGDMRSPNAPVLRTALAVSGCDKVNAAMTLTCLLQAMSTAPELVLQVGIAGGFAARWSPVRARPGDVVIATQDSYSDTGSSTPEGWISAAELGIPIAQVDGAELGGVFPADPELVEWALDVLGGAGLGLGDGQTEAPDVLAGPFVTSSTVTGLDDEAKLIGERWGALAESMEGAAAAHVCALHGVPFLELRAISNVVGDRDRSGWLVEDAAQTAARAALVLVAAMAAKGSV
jgi:futalosine hydrolase